MSSLYSATLTFAASSCGAAALPQPTVDFGFVASDVWVANTCGVRVNFTLDGTATTAMGYLSTGEVRYLQNLRTRGLGLATTSTSTGVGAQPFMSIMAWGSVLTAGSLFSSIGAGDLGLQQAGLRIAWQVERDPWRQALLADRFPAATRHVNVYLLPEALEPVDLLYADPPSADPEWMPPIWRVVERLRPAALMFNSGGRCAQDLATHLQVYGYSGIGLAVTATARRPDTDLTRYRTMALALRDSTADVLLPLLDQEGTQSLAEEPDERARSIPEMVEHVLGLPRGWTCRCQPFAPDACAEQTDRLVALAQCCPPSVTRWTAAALVERMLAVAA